MIRILKASRSFKMKVNGHKNWPNWFILSRMIARFHQRVMNHDRPLLSPLMWPYV